MDMDDNDRLVRLERKIDDLGHMVISAISLGIAWIVASLVSDLGWAKEYGLPGELAAGLVIGVTFIVVGATLSSKFSANDRGRM